MFTQKNRHRKTFLQIFIVITLWWIVLFVIGVLARLVLPFTNTFSMYAIQEASSLPDWIKHWANFDGVTYLLISEKWYKGYGLIQAYFPAFPILISLVTPALSFLVPLCDISILDVRFISTIILNFVLSFLFLLVANKYFTLRFSLRERANILLSFLFFPTAFFIHTAYTEALFLFLLVLSLYLYQTKRWLFLTLSLLSLTACRVVGIFLVPALLGDLYIQFARSQEKFSLSQILRFIRKFYQAIIAILTGSTGLVLFMIYLQLNFQDPLYFFHVQSSFGAGRQQTIVLFPQVVWRYLKILWTARPLNLMYFNYVQELFFTMITLLILILAFVQRKKLKITYAELLFSLGAFFLPPLTGNFSSMPRYILVCLPIFIVMSQLLDHSRLVKYLYIILGFSLSCFNIILFIQGHWVA